MNRIAIFGGTFNPIHNGHLHIAQQFQKQLCAQRVLFIPTFVPPHKRAPDLAPAEDRLEMCRLACEGTPFEVSDLEIRRGGPSYTAETLLALKREYPDAELCFLTGEDMFLTLETWYKPDVIYSLATICAAPRSTDGVKNLRDMEPKLFCKTSTICRFPPPWCAKRCARAGRLMRWCLQRWRVISGKTACTIETESKKEAVK